VTDSRVYAYTRAADCYEQAGLLLDAARCHRAAGAFRRAGDLLLRLGVYRQAAQDYADGDLRELAGWVLVHHAGDPVAARVMAMPLKSSALRKMASYLGLEPVEQGLREQLVLARCELAEGAGPGAVLPVLRTVCDELAREQAPYDRFVEEWAVTLAECVHRYDQVALVFAAAVRGGRLGAERRWQDWASRVLGTQLCLPSVSAEPSFEPLTSG
jgi:hypothetical protein